MITISILEFLFFSFLGWLLDSGYRSLTEKKWINAGYFKGPLCPIYGFGGLVLMFIFKQLNFLLPWLLILVAAIGVILVEYLGGLFTEKVLKVKLWDYSQSQYHLGGHIDLRHSLYWLVLSVAFYFFVYPPIRVLERILFIPEYLELPMFLLFMISSLWLTIRKNPGQFLVLKGKMINLTVEKYRDLFSNITKLYKTTSLPTQKELRRIIQKQLKDTGAYLKRIR